MEKVKRTLKKNKEQDEKTHKQKLKDKRLKKKRQIKEIKGDAVGNDGVQLEVGSSQGEEEEGSAYVSAGEQSSEEEVQVPKPAKKKQKTEKSAEERALELI